MSKLHQHIELKYHEIYKSLKTQANGVEGCKVASYDNLFRLLLHTY